ncbi:MAG: hypothetical protein KGI27_12910 [Thaumarchaeota archaeon]|nr:hypothetical protein [Nitrososphaerota archaeon]
MTNKIYRHGDITLRLVQKVEGKEVENNGSFVIANGETTGHRHLITAEIMTVRQAENGRYYLSLGEAGTLTHEEHKTLTIPAGDYEVVREREYEWFQKTTRQVVD